MSFRESECFERRVIGAWGLEATRDRRGGAKKEPARPLGLDLAGWLAASGSNSPVAPRRKLPPSNGARSHLAGFSPHGERVFLFALWLCALSAHGLDGALQLLGLCLPPQKGHEIERFLSRVLGRHSIEQVRVSRWSVVALYFQRLRREVPSIHIERRFGKRFLLSKNGWLCGIA